MLGKMPLFVYAPFHYQIYNKSELEQKLIQNGFKILKLRSSHILFSTRRNPIGIIFEILGDWFPTFSAHLIVLAKKIS